MCIILTSNASLKNKSVLDNLLSCDKKIYVFFSYEVKYLKGTTFYKTVGSSKFVNCKPIHSKFGDTDLAQVRRIKDLVLSLPQYKGVFDGGLVEWLVLNSRIGGIMNDLDAVLLVASTYGITNMDDLYCLTSCIENNYMLGVISAIKNMDWEKVYSFLDRKDINYTAFLDILRGTFFNYSKAFNAFKDEGYEIDLNRIQDLTDLKYYYISKSMKYLNKMGHEKIDYVYRYLCSMMSQEVGGKFTHDDGVKRRDLGLVLMGFDSLLLK